MARKEYPGIPFNHRFSESFESLLFAWKLDAIRSFEIQHIFEICRTLHARDGASSNATDKVTSLSTSPALPGSVLAVDGMYEKRYMFSC